MVIPCQCGYTLSPSLPPTMILWILGLFRANTGDFDPQDRVGRAAPTRHPRPGPPKLSLGQIPDLGRAHGNAKDGQSREEPKQCDKLTGNTLRVSPTFEFGHLGPPPPVPLTKTRECKVDRTWANGSVLRCMTPRAFSMGMCWYRGGYVSWSVLGGILLHVPYFHRPSSHLLCHSMFTVTMFTRSSSAIGRMPRL